MVRTWPALLTGVTRRARFKVPLNKKKTAAQLQIYQAKRNAIIGVSVSR